MYYFLFNVKLGRGSVLLLFPVCNIRTTPWRVTNYHCGLPRFLTRLFPGNSPQIPKHTLSSLAYLLYLND